VAEPADGGPISRTVSQAESKPAARRPLTARMRPFRTFYQKWPFTAVLPLCAVYVAYWFTVGLDRYYSFHAAVFDLGVEMQGAWIFTQTAGWSGPGAYLEQLAYTPTRFVFSPITIGFDYPALLLFQAIALASGAVAVHAIARHHLGGHLAPFFLSLAYLVYPPLAGLTWFDFHWEVLFVPLFLFGYLFTIRRQFAPALVLLLLAGLATFPYLLVIGLFGLVLSIEALWPRLARGSGAERAKLRFGLALFILSAAFLVYQAADLSSFSLGSLLALSAFKGAAHAATGSSPVLSNRLLVLLVFLGPLLALPLFSPKWVILLIPFGFLVLASGCVCYAYPNILQLQYGAIAAPLVFAGGIEVLGVRRQTPKDLEPKAEPPPPRAVTGWSKLGRVPWRLPVRLTPSRARTVATAIGVLAILLALFYQPYGPWNPHGPDPFPLGELRGANLTFFSEMEHLVNLIPRSAPYVLFQNDMPYALPRVLDYQQTPLVSSEIAWLNLSTWDVAENQFPLELPGGSMTNARISYLVDNPEGPLFYSSTTPGISMYSFVRALYESGLYGVVGEASGMLLLERGYAGPVQYFVPYSQNYSARSLYSWVNAGPSGTTIVERTNVSGGRVWWGPYALLSPGTYRATLWMRTTNLSPTNTIEVQATTNDGQDIHAETNVTGSDFSAVDQWEPISFTFDLNDTSNTVEFASWNAYWSGTIAIEGATVNQIAPADNPLT
jgi:uncharacterized membrane protein